MRHCHCFQQFAKLLRILLGTRSSRIPLEIVAAFDFAVESAALLTDGGVLHFSQHRFPEDRQ